MRKLTNEEFLQKAKRTNQRVDVVGVYENAHKKVECRCKFCGESLWISPDNIYRGKGCKRCSSIFSRTVKTTEQFIDELSRIQPNIQVLGDYLGAHDKIPCMCKQHQYIFKSSPTHLLNHQTGCVFCIREKKYKYEESRKKECLELMRQMSPNIDVVGDLYNVSQKVRVRCRKCGYEWENSPAQLMRYHGCPKCDGTSGERAIQMWLDEHNITYECQKKYPDLLRGLHDRMPLSYDFYVPAKQTLIEY